MKVLIAYAGKTGTTDKCAKMLGNKLKECTLINLDNESVDISNYDIVVVGASVRMGMIHKKVKKFIENNKSELLNKKVAFFVCNGFVEKTDEVIASNIPTELVGKAISIKSFGGELNLDKLKGFDKIITKVVTKSNNEVNKCTILVDNISKFAEVILSV